MAYFVIALVTILVVLYFIARHFYNLVMNRNAKNFFSGNMEEKGLSESRAQLNQWFDEHGKPWSLKSRDGLNLNAYYIENKTKSDTVVLMAHGYLGQASEISAFAQIFYNLGFDCLAPDARGHGKSEGDYYGFGWNERLDYQLWIQKIIEYKGPDVKILLYGISMGAATVMMTSGETLPDNVKLVIEDCGYTSVYDEMAFQIKNLFKLPAFPIIHATSLYAKMHTGFRYKEASCVNQLKKNRLPILLIHGEADNFVPYFMLDELMEAANEPKEAYRVPGAKHGGAFNADPEKYTAVITDFVNKYL